MKAKIRVFEIRVRPTVRSHLSRSMSLSASWSGTKRMETLPTATRGMTEKRVGPNRYDASRACHQLSFRRCDGIQQRALKAKRQRQTIFVLHIACAHLSTRLRLPSICLAIRNKLINRAHLLFVADAHVHHRQRRLAPPGAQQVPAQGVRNTMMTVGSIAGRWQSHHTRWNVAAKWRVRA